ncbi:MAG TPA: carboxyl transferase domain-containing protein [Actinophytocola sp.]|uniref:ATP-binding protein n=1 Tax=Actinophytocola sp. TaxID=1872138 RepID=UPI002DBDB4D4|nr:carboxyl transferase domain-containing protein [Actinophytocola sp.]HEU5470989.1 carboxyl transferase domain-containing protein [Actinophytocola sp.]
MNPVVNAFHRVAIVNRGEPAMRFLNAVAELNREGGEPLTTIAVYTEPDRHAMFVREADEAVCVGPATVFDQHTGRERQSYVDYERLEQALAAARADAVWVGWGFVAEHADFADLCDKLGVVFLGPPGDAMRRVGDKIGAKRLAERVGVPVVPWSGGPVADLAAATAQAARIGFPLLVKASGGGGGRGIRRVVEPGELSAAFEAARTEARHAFGDPSVFLERALRRTRHVEVQVIADRHGTVWPVGLRDCSLQRRHQKVIEESACPLLDAGQEAEIRAAAAQLCRCAGYTGAGTVEFLYAPDTRDYYFLEVNARLQVEHPVTELTTGLDLVKLQIAVARGERLGGAPPVPSGHAIEARLNAEDADNGFAPAPGRIRRFRPPCGPGIRVETGVAEGDAIAPEFDSMIAKILAWGRNREEARARLIRALVQTQVIVEGGRTNKAFLLTLLGHSDVVAGRFDTGWLDARMSVGELLEPRHADVALVAAAVEAYAAEHALHRAAFYADVARGRPGPPPETGQRIEFRYRGRPYALHVRQLGPRTYRITTGGSTVDVEVERLGDAERRLVFADRAHRVLTALAGPVHTVEVEGVTHTITRDEGGVVHSRTPAVVVSVAVAAGDRVAVGDPLAVLECMKMETSVRATFPGRVRSVLVAPNQQIDAGAPLLRLDPVISSARPAPDGLVELDFPGKPMEAVGAMRAYLLGYDVDPASIRPAGRADALPVAGEAEVLQLFADVCAVSRRAPEPADETVGERVRAAEEHLLTCLRTYETGGDGLPPAFLRRLMGVLRHHGIERLVPSTEVADALLRLYRAQQRLDTVAGVVAGILDRWLAHRPPNAEDLRGLLDHLIATTDRRFPDILDRALDVRFRFFEQPILARARTALYAEMDGHIIALATGTGPEEQARRMAALIACPQPLRPALLRWYQRGTEQERAVALEVAARRYYRIRDVTDVTLVAVDGIRMAAADYHLAGFDVHLMVGCSPVDDLPALVPAVVRHLAAVAAEPVLDLHLWQDTDLGEANAVRDRLLRDLNGFGRPMHRVDVTITATTSGVTYHYTFRSRSDSGLVEDELYRNMHPMLAKRLNLDRLRHFAITRLDSAEDVYLFHGIARTNPKDERLFALAEVRDLTPVRDEAGRVTGFPLLERIMAEILSGIRRYQAHRPPGQRLLKNLVLLHVRPRWTYPVELWRDLAHKLAPAIRGLGIEHVIVRGRLGDGRELALDVTNPGERGVVVTPTEPSDEPIEPLDEYGLRVLRSQRRGDVHPYELIRLLTPPAGSTSDFPAGDFVEHDLDEEGGLLPVDRPPGGNTANLVVGLIRNSTSTVPEGMRRVLIASDPSRSLGALAEPECRRIIAALDLAQRDRLPVEWFAVSSGARISMASGTENMDWIGAVLRRIITFTQAGGEINIVVTGINVGAQPYWNAEATMLMHTCGVLIMLPDGAMVLTGKQALDFSGGVSAEDNLGIGGFQRIMGPNGQAQYHAADLESACEILFRHYAHTYVVPGERFPRRAVTTDPAGRDVRAAPHTGFGFSVVGDIFSAEANPERKKPFDIRSVMRAVSDTDHEPLERWEHWRHADTAVVWDACLGGIPVCLIGFESHPVAREGLVPGDGPSAWTSGTLFPQSSKKVARAINAASGNRPVVVLANLSGFDGSPESMRLRQLEYGAEIGRAVTNFDGPIVFAVISRYHGGAFVVFSKRLNENLEVVAVEGAYASVIGGAPAAAVVFAREVSARTKSDPRVPGADREVVEAVHAVKLGEVAREFDEIHSITRALEVGSVDRIIPAAELRHYLITAVERGMARAITAR